MAPGLVRQSVFSWNTTLSKFVKAGQVHKALEVFRQMQAEGFEPNNHTFVAILKACASVSALEEGRRIHKQLIERDLESDVFVGNSLLAMYSKLGTVEDALRVFNRMPKRDMVTWNSMVAAYVRCGRMGEAWTTFNVMPARDVVSWNTMLTGHVNSRQGQKALNLFLRMQAEGVKPNAVSFLMALKACVGSSALEEGRRIHAQIIRGGYEPNVAIQRSLVDMYAKCGSIEDSWRIIRKMPKTDVLFWNATLSGYVKSERGLEALKLFQQMQAAEVRPNNGTFVIIINACARLAALEEGRRTHAQVVESGFESDIVIGNSLVDMYAKCGSIKDAEIMFNKMCKRNVVSWNAMLTGYLHCDKGQKTLDLFRRMQAEGVRPNSVTYLLAVKACASLGALEEGRHTHSQVVESSHESDLALGNSLVDMYAKCGSIEDAWKMFSKLPVRNVVSWNAMLAGYVKCGQCQKALDLFQEMQSEGVKPDSITFSAVAHACSSLGALEEGRCVHAMVIEHGCEDDVIVGNSLIDMYAKCGSIDDASRIFRNMPVRSVVSWTAMLGGLAMHGHGKEALGLFQEMYEKGLLLNEVTFVCLLSACSHAGLVEEGLHYFGSMRSAHGISPTSEHYACMVDLLGRAGRLTEAEDMVKGMPCDPTSSAYVHAWKALLGACRNHNNLEMGERVAKRVLELEPGDSCGYVLLSNIYAAAGQWDKRDKIQQLKRERGVRKEPGRAWIQVNKQLHSFLANDQRHPERGHIDAKLRTLFRQMQEAGYVPDTHVVFHDVEEEVKLLSLGHHSEKLAIAFGLIHTPHGTPLYIFKNLRMCADCHTVTKYISKLQRREIIVRDANRFHHFKDGLCTCAEYW